MDTAPTDTLLLLDATGAYHRDIVRQMGTGVHFTTPMMQLAGPMPSGGAGRDHTGARSGQPAGRPAPRRHRTLAWAINNSVAAAPSPLLRQRARNELREIETVVSHAVLCRC